MDTQQIAEAVVNLPDDIKNKFTDVAITELNKAVSEYARKLISEAESEERLQLNATKTVEITAQIVDSAKWQIVSKMRRRARHYKLLLVLQMVMGVLMIPIGIGASNFDESWGQWLCILCGLAYVMILVVHSVISSVYS